MLETEYSGFRGNTMPADVWAPKFTRASAGMVLVLQNKIKCIDPEFHLLESSQIQDMIQNVNTYFIIFNAMC